MQSVTLLPRCCCCIAGCAGEADAPVGSRGSSRPGRRRPPQAPAPLRRRQPFGSKPAASKPVVSKPAAPLTVVPRAAAVTPTLDLAALKERLKATKAIGVFTKLSLKNQVDDLLDQFGEYYQGKAKLTMTQLRRSYDLLMMKVLRCCGRGPGAGVGDVVFARGDWVLAEQRRSKP